MMPIFEPVRAQIHRAAPAPLRAEFEGPRVGEVGKKFVAHGVKIAPHEPKVVVEDALDVQSEPGVAVAVGPPDLPGQLMVGPQHPFPHLSPRREETPRIRARSA